MMLHFCVLYVDFIKYKVWLTGICLLQAPLITIFLGAHLQPGFPNTTLTLQRSLMKQFCGQGLQQPFPGSVGPKTAGSPLMVSPWKECFWPKCWFWGVKSQDFWGQSWERRKSTTEKTVDLPIPSTECGSLKSWPLKKASWVISEVEKKTCRMHGFWLLCFVNRDIFTLRMAFILGFMLW